MLLYSVEPVLKLIMWRIKMITILFLILEHTDGSGWSPAVLHPDTSLLHHDHLGLHDLHGLFRRPELQALYLRGLLVSGSRYSTSGALAPDHQCHAPAR